MGVCAEGGIQVLFVLSTQFFCKAKNALKKKKSRAGEGESWGEGACMCTCVLSRISFIFFCFRRPWKQQLSIRILLVMTVHFLSHNHRVLSLEPQSKRENKDYSDEKQNKGEKTHLHPVILANYQGTTKAKTNLSSLILGVRSSTCRPETLGMCLGIKS